MEINFKINGKLYTVNPETFPSEMSLNTFVRENLGLTGTKFMCLEGGCGCCIVNIVGHNPGTKEPKSWAANSCLTLLNLCDGWAITTIEGLGNKRKGFHPIQRKLAQMNGTQCGYCSPAMVMNMYSLLKSREGKVNMDEVENSFSGNLCRCTGYRPILDAMKSFARDSQDMQDIEDLSLSCIYKELRGMAICKDLLKVVAAKDGKKWYFPANIEQIFKGIKDIDDQSYTFVCGNTAHGVYRRSEDIKNFIKLNHIEVLHQYSVDETLVIGGNVTLADAKQIFEKCTAMEGFEYCQVLLDHFDLIANIPVRNMGSIAGNLMIKHTYPEFPSDVHVVFSAVSALINIMEDEATIKTLTLDEFYSTDMRGKLILSFELPKYNKNIYKIESYKIMPRSQNSHAYVNAAFLIKFNENLVESAKLCFGGINSSFTKATDTQALFVGKDLSDESLIKEIFTSLHIEIIPDGQMLEVSPEYRKLLASSLFYKFILSIRPLETIKPEFQSGKDKLKRDLSHGNQVFDIHEKFFPISKPVIKLEGPVQCSGEALYSNDINPMINEVFCAFVTATVVGAEIEEIDPSDALKTAGVLAFYSAKNIPGKNSFVKVGMLGFTQDEELFVESTVKHYDQPLGVIVAESNDIANRAASKVKVMYSNTNYKVICDLKSAMELKDRSRIKNISSIGYDVNDVCAGKLVKGQFDMTSQYHFFMEPHTTVCIPNEDGIKVLSSTQWIDLTQVAIASVLNVKQNYIHVEVRRLGGSYGGKVSRGTQAACACALAAHILNRPARFIQSLESTMNSTGKRFSNNSNYEVKVKENGQILSLKNVFYQDCGWSENENAIEFHSAPMARNCYQQTSSWKIEGNAVLTDTPSNTWIRGPGSLEGVSMMENIIDHIAVETKLDPVDVRYVNLASGSKMREILPKFVQNVDYRIRQLEIKKFNASNRWRKKGLSVSVMEYPIFYFDMMYPVTLSVYHTDGSVLISHGIIEMGQGLNTKLAQVASYFLGCPLDYVNVIKSDSFNGADSKLLGASVGSDSLGFAVRKCCLILLDRLKPIRKIMKNPTWAEITRKAYEMNINLIVSDCFKDEDLQKYSVWGCCATEVEVDILTGNIIVQKVDILEDTGESLSPLIDIGQIEGAFVMGLGYWLTEQLIFENQLGKLLTNRTWNYKIPGAKDIPVDFRIELMQKSSNASGFMRSKATGEPAICLSVSVVFAIRRAIESARRDAGLSDGWFELKVPLTPESIMMACQIDPLIMFNLN